MALNICNTLYHQAGATSCFVILGVFQRPWPHRPHPHAGARFTAASTIVAQRHQDMLIPYDLQVGLTRY